MSIRDEKSSMLNLLALLEIALSIGQSTDLKENCRKFLRAIHEFFPIRNASVWMVDPLSDSPNLKLIWGYPKPVVLPLPARHILELLGKEKRAPLDIPGKVDFFALGAKGFLAIELDEETDRMLPKERAYFERVVDNLASSLSTSISYQRLEQAERRLAITEKKERQIIETSLDAVILVDGDAKITEWGNRAEQLLGYKAEEAVGKRWYRLVFPETEWSRLDEQVWRFQRFGEFPAEQYQAIDIMATDKSGHQFPAEFSYSHIKADDDHHFCLFIRDITQRKRAEDELREAKSTAEAAKLAERKFLTNMSHEIRTPMNTVIGMIHLLRETPLDHRQQEYLDALKFSADNLLGIINNILDLRKIEAGEFEISRQLFDLRSLLKSLRQSYQLKIERRPVRIELQIDPRLQGPVIGDYTRLNQILGNLLSNSCNFTEKGKITLSVQILEEYADRYLLEFSVRDTGIGIEPEKIPLIFQNFKQVNQGESRTAGGSGLGLSIVKQLVDLQGGEILVESRKGKGTDFIVSLSFDKPGEAGEDLRQLASAFTQYGPEPDLSGLQVLVVEDDPMNRLLVQRLLENWGCDFALVTGGGEALRKLRAQRFDVVLIDLHMWDMNGIEITQRLRAELKNPNRKTPVIALTAAALLEEKKRALEVGMSDFLTKPFSPEALQHALKKVVASEQGALQVTADQDAGGSTSLAEHFQYLNSFSQGDEAFIREMVEAFLEELPLLMKELKKSLSDKDDEALSLLVHRLKPSLQMLEQSGLLQQVKALEQDWKSDASTPVAIRTKIDRLLAGLEQVQVDLRKILQ